MPNRRLALPVLVLLIAFAVRTLDLSAQSLWYDEGYTVMFAQRSIGAIIVGAAQLELNTPLHYLVLKLWMLFAGTSEFSARLISTFAGVITVAFVGHALRGVPRWVMRHATEGVPHDYIGCHAVPMLLVALSPVCVLMSREVRMYALAACLCTASVAMCVACLRRNRASLWVGWVLISLAAFATHVLAAFFIGAQVPVLAARWIRRRHVSRVELLSMSAVLALIVLVAALILRGGGSYGTSFRDRLNPLTTLEASAASQLLPRLLPESLVAPAAIAALGLSVLAGIVTWRRGGAMTQVWFIGIVTIVLIALFSTVTGKFSSRYPALAAPLFLIGLGLALAPRPVGMEAARSLPVGSADPAMRRPKPLLQILRVALTAILVLRFTIGLWQLRTSGIYANDDWRGVATFVKANVQPDETVLLVSGHTAPMFVYYFGATGWTALPNDAVLNVNHALTWESAMPMMNAALTGRGGAWLVLWQDDLIDPTGLVPALLRRQSQAFAPALDTPQFNGLRLQHYRFFQPYRPLAVVLPPGTSRIEAVGQNAGLSSLGCNQPQPTHAGDGWLEVHCFWQVKPFVQLSGFTKVSLRLFDSRGKQVLQSDQPIAPNGMPYYPFEKPILGLYLIELPNDIAPGDYMLRAVPYAEQGELSPQVVTPIHITTK